MEVKLYKTRSGIVIESEARFFQYQEQEWDTFINDDELLQKVTSWLKHATPLSGVNNPDQLHLEAPVGEQEIWASGVTYKSSKLARQAESKEMGGSDFYAKVYSAKRPELFFKAMGYKVIGPGGNVRIRSDSKWNVPEPELTLFVSSSGCIIGYTIGNDMSSRSIEGANPLYLPQAKTYDGSVAIGPCVVLRDTPLPASTTINMKIFREGSLCFTGETTIRQMKRRLKDLVEFLFRENSFVKGCYLMTGTGIIPPEDFTLFRGDIVWIEIEGIGVLSNPVN